MVTLTNIAAEKVNQFMEGQGAEGDIGLRVGVRGGGCSGFQYALALDERRDDDHVFDAAGIRVLVDPASLRYVDGSTVDFTESFQGSGFEVRTRTWWPPAAAAPRSALRTKSRAAAPSEDPRGGRAAGSGRYAGLLSSELHRYRHASVL